MVYFKEIITEKSDENTEQPIVEKFGCDISSYGSIAILYGIVHFLAFIYAVYLSFKKNGGFKIMSFLVACCCPWLYIIYAFSVKSSYCKGVIQKEIQTGHLCKC